MIMEILISDTHYGVKQNSITWLNSQLDFIYKQLIPFCREQNEKSSIYHLGDVFDSRSSINPFVASRVRKAFKDLYKVSKEMIILGGNHDYYSPNEDSIDSINMVLHEDDEFKPTVVTKDIYLKGQDLFIPWYRFNDVEDIKRYIEDYNVSRVFVHADITMLDDEHKRLFKGLQVFSGHIHTPKHYKNLHTLGSTYALTFADSNDDRGFYVLQEEWLRFVPNEYTIRFHRLYNDEIFNDVSFSKVDYIELYVDQLNLLNERYTSRIKELTNKYHNINIIPKSTISDDKEFEKIDLYNIEELCKQCIPDELKEKFLMISQDEQ